MRRLFRGILIVLLMIWAIVIGGMFFYTWYAFHNPKEEPEIIMPEIVNTNLSQDASDKMKGYWTIAIFGLDSRDGQLGRGSMSDLELICNMNLETGEVRVVSIYRDTYLKINSEGKFRKINEAYFFGGPTQAVEALNENLDLNIDHYVAFNWKAVVDAINILGGIDVEITEKEFQLINGFITETVNSTGVGSVHLKSPGMNHLDGVQAVAYARLRKIDTDFKRTKRQREIIELLAVKAREADFSVLNNLLVTILPQVSTSLKPKDLLPLAKNVKKFHITDAFGFPFTMEDKKIRKQDCIVPTTLKTNVMELHKRLFDQLDYVPSTVIEEISQYLETIK